MAAPRTTIWNLDPHTRAKHDILRRYLQAWIPILSLGRFPEILYIDGFAGPGRYSQGEDGSPIIALRSALDQTVEIKAKLRFLFVEKENDRAQVLQEVVDGVTLPDNFDVTVAAGQTFESAFADLTGHYGRRGRSLPPAFAFIDPFGWTGAPFSVVTEIMRQPNCEVLVTFMYEEINRFIGHPDQEANFDAFFGTPEWRSCVQTINPHARNRCLHDLYQRQLREVAGANYVRSFQMRNERDVTDYYLFYATNSLLGLKRMKSAMWRVDESGEFTFSDATDPNQMILFAKEPRFDVLRRQILERFQGSETTIEEVERFVLAETAFIHYKRQVLKPLELATPRQLEAVDPPPGRKRGTYGQPGLRLRFFSTPQ